MKNLIKIVVLTTIGLGSVSCSFSGQMGSYVDKQTSSNEAGMKAYGQTVSDIIYTSKSRGRGDNEAHETYKLRESQEQTKRDGLAWKLRKYLRGDTNKGGQ